ncbi:hypothetical protein B296_00056452 [Ensete ventricosum]|uniref:Uncharacterized protein n=1 Tax=Ensete ventricosum TaxID=4639 RepID=A0A426XV90_ENSVE|nr:hypothetical protein B296_00056452 [Ensete ventricosum]
MANPPPPCSSHKQEGRKRTATHWLLPLCLPPARCSSIGHNEAVRGLSSRDPFPSLLKCSVIFWRIIINFSCHNCSGCLFCYILQEFGVQTTPPGLFCTIYFNAASVCRTNASEAFP